MLRCLIIQSLHPLAMAGVAQHSNYAKRPIDRLHRTAAYIAATAFGDIETANRAIAHVRRRHATVRGIDPVTGRAYSAEDPDTQLWVHSTAWHSMLAAYRVFGGRLSPEEEDRYFAEGVVIGSLLGTAQESIAASRAEMRAYFERVRPQLCVSEASRAAIEFVASPSPVRELLRYYAPWRICANAAVALVPRSLRVLAGIDRRRIVDAAAIATTKPLVTGLRLPLARQVSTAVVGAEATRLVRARLRPDPTTRQARLGRLRL